MYINPINGKKRYWRKGQNQSRAIPDEDFDYLDTGIRFPDNTMVIVATARVTDKAISVTPKYGNTVAFSVQSYYNGAKAHVYWYYELEEL